MQAACRIALALDGNVLAIQGPPGTGKTYTGAHIICALVRAGLKVGVTAVSHKVIVNLLEGAAKQAREEGRPISIVHREEGVYPGQHGIERRHDYDDDPRGRSPTARSRCSAPPRGAGRARTSSRASTC